MSNIHEILNLREKDIKEILKLRKEIESLREELNTVNAAHKFVSEFCEDKLKELDQ